MAVRFSKEGVITARDLAGLWAATVTTHGKIAASYAEENPKPLTLPFGYSPLATDRLMKAGFCC